MKNKIKHIISAFLILLLPAIAATRVMARDDSAAGLPRYEIKASVDTGLKSIDASQTVTFTNNYSLPVSELFFHIYPHRKYTKKEIRGMSRYAGYFKVNPYPEGFQSGDLKVKEVLCQGKPLSFNIEGEDQTILKVDLPQAVAKGHSVTVDISFSVRMPHSYGRFGWHRNITALTRWYPILSVYDDAGWHNYPFYIFHQPFFSDAAYYRLEVTIEQKQKVISGGAAPEETINADGTKTLVFKPGHPMRDLGVGISPDFEAVRLDQDGYTINAYYIDGNKSSAEKAAVHAARLMRFYGARFGEYPYKEFSIVPAYLGFGGDQSSGMVFIDTRLYRLPGALSRYFDFIVSHETGHQWFYNLVGSDEYTQMFIDEGMNSYWVLRYLEDTYGANALVLDLPKPLGWIIPNFSFRDSTVARYSVLAKGGYDRPVIGELSGFREPSSIFALAYGKGSAILMMLESILGRETFDRIVERYAREYRFKNFEFSDLERIASEESGRDLSYFFDQWFKTANKCDYAVKRVGRESVTIENRQTIALPVKTILTYADGSVQVDEWDGSGKEHVIPLEQPGRVSRVDIDPDNSIVLDLDRINNHRPALKAFKPVPFYFFAYEMPFFYKRDSYTAVAGPKAGPSFLGIGSCLQRPYDSIVRLSSMYDFDAKALDSSFGYQLNNIAGRQNSAGFEIFDYESSKEKQDVSGGKVYMRRELWPANYGLFGVNDHATLYFIRDQRMDSSGGLNGSEDIRNMRYKKKNEAIFGLAGSLGRYGPYADPDYGWRFIPVQEVAGHILGGTQSFWRTSAELQRYFLVWQRKQHKIAARLKGGLGGPSDKSLFELGGADSLRGYSRKDVQGARAVLAGVEYRMPVFNDLRIYFIDNIFCLNSVQAVGFFDVGKAWDSSFGDRSFKKDAGLGLRFHLGVLAGLEKLVVRIDAARAINDPKEDTHFWFGINQAF